MNRTEQPREDKLNVTITRKRMKNLYLRVLAPDGRVAISGNGGFRNIRVAIRADRADRQSNPILHVSF